MNRSPERAILLAVATLLGACASVDPDAALRPAAEAAGRETGTTLSLSSSGARDADVRARLAAGPLDADDAVRLALANSAAMQALLADSVAAQNRLSRQGGPGSLRFAFERTSRNGEVELTRLLGIGLIDLVTWPMRNGLVRDAVEAERWRLASDVLRTAHEARRAWVDAVASQQRLKYQNRVYEVADATGELARRMQAAGNWSRLQQSRQQLFAANAMAERARASATAVRDREVLVRVLGLSDAGAAALKLPDRLPDLPASPRSEADIAATARADRLDVTIAEQRWRLASRQRGFASATSWGDIDLATIRTRESGLPLKKGWELELAVPLSDLGAARREASSAEELAALARLEQAQRDAGSLLRERIAAYRHAHELARSQRDIVMPLAQTIADESRLAYNGMIIGTFEMLADAQAQIRSVISAIDAERDFWLADAALLAAMRGVPAPGALPGSASGAMAGVTAEGH